MSGKELKKILCDEGVNLSELARMLGFANDQRLHSALNADDVKSGLIEKIAKCTNKSIGFFYQSTPDMQMVGAGSNNTNSHHITVTSSSDDDLTAALLSQLHEKDRQLSAQATQIDNLIQLLTSHHSSSST